MASVLCPICAASVPSASIDAHVNSCLDAGAADAVPVVRSGSKRAFVDVTAAAPSGIGGGDVDDDDAAFAQALQEEENRSAKRPTPSTACVVCSAAVSVDDLFILDECSHKCHRACASAHVLAQIATSLVVLCPVPSCTRQMSVRDLKELVGDAAHAGKASGGGGGSKGSRKGAVRHDATQRLMSELELISKSNPEASGFSVEPIDDDLYQWEIKLFGFEDGEPLAKDLKKVPGNCVTLHATFPADFPFAPPFLRVIRPRFRYMTGHITVGGSICFELLTKSGWSALNTLESVIVSIRTNMLVGGARIEKGNMPDYSLEEAREAFERTVQKHGW